MIRYSLRNAVKYRFSSEAIGMHFSAVSFLTWRHRKKLYPEFKRSSGKNLWGLVSFKYSKVTNVGQTQQIFNLNLIVIQIINMDRDSSVSIATRYGLEGPRIESRWRRDFLHRSRQALGPTQHPIQGYRVFPGGKAARAWRWPPTPSTTTLKKE